MDTKLLAEKCLSLRMLIGNSLHAKSMAVFRHKNEFNALIQIEYILADVHSCFSWLCACAHIALRYHNIFVPGYWYVYRRICFCIVILYRFRVFSVIYD